MQCIRQYESEFGKQLIF